MLRLVAAGLRFIADECGMRLLAEIFLHKCQKALCGQGKMALRIADDDQRPRDGGTCDGNDFYLTILMTFFINNTILNPSLVASFSLMLLFFPIGYMIGLVIRYVRKN